MNARAPRAATTKVARKKSKLKLNKETLKDLTAAGKAVKGGERPPANDSRGWTCGC